MHIPVWLVAVVLATGCGGPTAVDPQAATDADGLGADAGAGEVSAGDVGPHHDAGATWQWQGRVASLVLPARPTQDGTTAPWTFQPPSGTRSLLVQLDGPPAVHLAVAQWQDGAGKLLTVPSWLQGPLAPWLCIKGCLFRQASRPQQQVALVPNAPLPVALQGAHQLRGYAWIPAAQPQPVQADVSLRVFAVTGAPLSQGRLRVNLCLTGALGITAAVAAQHPRVQQAIADVQAIFGGAGITVEVALHDLAGVAPVVTHDDADLEISDVLAKGADLPLGVNVVLVERVVRGEAMAPVLGLSGGIPGPPLQVGGAQGGVVVSLALGPGEPDRLGIAIAHELGHFLGLFHSSESSAADGETLHDALVDTADHDPANLMYWSPTPDSRSLSASQAAILRDSPWVEPLP